MVQVLRQAVQTVLPNGGKILCQRRGPVNWLVSPERKFWVEADWESDPCGAYLRVTIAQVQDNELKIEFRIYDEELAFHVEAEGPEAFTSWTGLIRMVRFDDKIVVNLEQPTPEALAFGVEPKLGWLSVGYLSLAKYRTLFAQPSVFVLRCGQKEMSQETRPKDSLLAVALYPGTAK